MRAVEPMEIGLVFWAEQEPATIFQQVLAFGIHAGQLGIPSQLNCDATRDQWANDINQFGVSISSVVCSYLGEDYSSLSTVHKTVGFTNDVLRADRIARTQVVSDFAGALGISALSCHIGFIPSDAGDILYKDLHSVTRLLCDYCAMHGQNFVLETGQESAEVLLSFITKVDRNNLKINFDPANMIMYGVGDPLAALRMLTPHVLSFHCKDARPPTANNGLLGAECALGDGEVDFPAILRELKAMNYRGLLSIEREESDVEKRNADIQTAINRLIRWKAAL